MDAISVLRQIVQSQMAPTPFRHKPSQKSMCHHSKLLEQVTFENNEMKDEFEADDSNQEESDDSEEFDDGDIEMSSSVVSGMELINLDKEASELFQILYATMRGKGNTSVVVHGSNGFGKSSLLSVVMHRLRQKCGNDSFIYIYLNALTQTTDIDALYVIVSQLQFKYGKTFNFSLENMKINNSQSEIKLKKTDFVNNLEFLVNELKKVTNDSNNKPIYIVLDNFELFAKRKKQTLLYNLFDLNHSQSSLLNIIGITKRKSVYESLEKRIRSRFIHKCIFVPKKTFLSTDSFELYFKIIYNTFIIHNRTQSKNKLLSKYNRWISEQFLDHKIFKNYIQKLHKFGYSPSKLMIVSGMVSVMIFDKKYFLKPLSNEQMKRFVSEIDNELFMNPFFRMINELSVNQLIVLVICCKLYGMKRYKFNFEIIYKMLQNVRKRDSMMIVAGKVQFFKCFKELIEMNFLVSASNKSKNNKLNTNDMLSKVFQARYDMVRLNRFIDSGDAILRYISQNVQRLPSWIDSWLLNNKTQIFL